MTRILFLAAALPLAAQQPTVNQRAVELARQTLVSTLDPGLPNQTLAQWLTEIAGPAAKIDWEVTDCGEQTGNPDLDRGRDFPYCVDVTVKLPGGRIAIVSVLVGSVQRGIAGPAKLGSVNIGVGNRFETVPKLRELPARIKAGN